jgi:hypothetical protein
VSILAAVMVTVLGIATGFILAAESDRIQRKTAARRQRVGFVLAMVGLGIACAYAILSAVR